MAAGTHHVNGRGQAILLISFPLWLFKKIVSPTSRLFVTKAFLLLKEVCGSIKSYKSKRKLFLILVVEENRIFVTKLAVRFVATLPTFNNYATFSI